VDGKSTAIHAAVLAPNDVTIHTYPDIPTYPDDGSAVLVFPDKACHPQPAQWGALLGDARPIAIAITITAVVGYVTQDATDVSALPHPDHITKVRLRLASGSCSTWAMCTMQRTYLLYCRNSLTGTRRGIGCAVRRLCLWTARGRRRTG
jgi:hypothetical protein